MFPVVQPGEDQARIPVTVENAFKENEYRTTGIYYSQLSQNTINANFTLLPAEATSDSLSTGLVTRMAVAIDFGNGNFLDTDNYFQVEAAKHLLYKFYLKVIHDFPE